MEVYKRMEHTKLIAAEHNAYYALVHDGVCKHRRHLFMAFVNVKCNLYSYFTTTPQCELFKIRQFNHLCVYMLVCTIRQQCCLCRDGGGCLHTVIQRKTAASVVQGFKSGELNWRGASMDYTPDSANRSST